MTPEKKLRIALGKHLSIPEDLVNAYMLTATTIPDDPVFGGRILVVMLVGRQTHILRVMTAPLQNEFSVHEVAVLS